MRLLRVLILTTSLCGAGGLALAGELTIPRLILHDFEQAASPTSGIKISGRTAGSGSDSGFLSYRLQPAHRPSSRQALYLHYRFLPGATEAIVWRLRLPDLDASAYDHLELWIRGDQRTGYADTLKLEFRQPLSGGPPGLLRQGSYVITGITDDWQRIRIPLNLMNGIEDWKQLRGLTLIWQPRRSPIQRGGYWLDDISLIKTGQPGPSIRDPVITPQKSAWETRNGGRTATQPLIQARLAGWPQRLIVNPVELPTDDHAFLQRLASDTWRGLAALTDREHGLPLDTVRLNGAVIPESAGLGDYTNVTNIGLYLIDIIAARELGLINAEDAKARLAQTLGTLEKLETWQGFFYNYYDTTTLERTSHFISLVDSAWLSAGLMVVRNSVPELAQRCTEMIEREDYRFFYDRVEQVMMHGYYVNLPYRSEYSYGLLYSEARLGSLIAIGKGQVPLEHWFRMARTFPRSFTWQRQSPKNRVNKTVNGYRFSGGYYSWLGLNYVPSWGGSLFEALMPLLVLDELQLAPASLGKNARVHTEVQRRFALKQLGYPVWGLSPSSMPDGKNYGEYGAEILGVRGYRGGAVTPHAAALALLTEPATAVANLQQLTHRYPIYGDFGFYDAVDPKTGQVAYHYLALNQSMILIALANHLRNGVIQRYFAADPMIQPLLPLLSAERFFE